MHVFGAAISSAHKPEETPAEENDANNAEGDANEATVDGTPVDAMAVGS